MKYNIVNLKNNFRDVSTNNKKKLTDNFSHTDMYIYIILHTHVYYFLF